MSAQVYWIRAPHHSDVMKEGYVGVSKNAQKRWLYGHNWAHRKGRHENPLLANAISKYGWDNLVKTILVIAQEEYCYDLERKLRPADSIGWNLAVGGNKPPVSKPRGDDYVSPLKGVPRPTPWMIGHAHPPSIEACIAGGKKVKGRKNTPEHLAKRMKSRRATRIARGQIRPLIVNGVQYEDSKIASLALSIPEATLKHWAYDKGKPSAKYAHITECRWL